ncbi:MAG: DUF2160 domain-containing protein [Rhodospirillales bacterium]|nr:DUF2160 domain-containing protein [Rhodospirillales bacterium]
MLDLSWMAWTWPTTAFFVFIFLCIAGMGIWEWKDPGGGPRHGILTLNTTRGDRLFITILGSAFIFLGWLALMGTPLWGALVISIAYGIGVFRWV